MPNDTYLRQAEAGMLTSGVKAADALIKTGAGKVYWLTVNDTADLTLQLNDSLANGGTDKWAIKLNVSVQNFGHFIFDPPIEFDTGIYLDVDTTTCEVIVGYI